MALSPIAFASTVALVGAMFPAAIVSDPIVDSPESSPIALTPVGSYDSGVFDDSAAEIVAYLPDLKATVVVNAAEGTVDVLDSSDPTNPEKTGTLPVAGVELANGGTVPDGSTANSVDVRADGLGVVAVEAPEKTDPGYLVFFDARNLEMLGGVTVTALPDMVGFSPDGSYVVSANEGEPSDEYGEGTGIDPEGTVAVVSAPGGIAAPSQDDVSIADFHAYDDETKTLHEDVRIYGPQAPNVDGEPERRISRNLEPEYAGVTDTHAYVSLQEANAIAVVDLATAEVTDVWPMGFIDRNVVPFDPSDRDPEDAPEFSLRTYEGVYGIPQPDTVEAFTVNGKDYIVTANEGDARDYDNYTEEARAKDLGDDGIPPACDDAPFADQLDDANLGRLNITLEMGLNEDGTCYEELYHYGSRSLSILDGDTGEIVYDSGSEFEEVTGELLPDFFNSNHSESNMEGRSDDKGPEPEGLTVGVIDDRTYAFVGFERVGGIIVYDVTDPAKSTYAGYVNNRDFSISMEDSVDAGTGEEDLSKAGDLGPEGLEFVPAAISPNGKDLLIVGNEVSGTTTFFEVELKETEEPAEPAPGIGFYVTNSWDSSVADAVFAYGRPGDEVLVGDWDGDGEDTFAVRRGHTFYVNDTLRGGEADDEFKYGRDSDKVLVGDWNNDGKDTFAVRRGDQFFVANSLKSGAADEVFYYGKAADEILVGDWDGDGEDTLAAKRGKTYFVKNEIAGGNADFEFKYGREPDLPLVGDWNGDGEDTFAVRRGNVVYLNNTLVGGDAEHVVSYGKDTDEVFVGDWDGDDVDTLAVRR
ncbi:choice-of-anchor I family protein [Flaviflexus sp.]|uniref:choice-of-anchor I family protein n=1 Tax=Flaviflexus sp. TaxID=1969482 RepID=UPI003F91D1EF